LALGFMPEKRMVSGREDILARLARIGGLPDEALDLGEAALLMGALDEQANALEHGRSHLADLVDRAGQLGAQALTASAMAGVLAQVLYEEAGYEGDRVTYDDPINANLLHVIERRRGLPVALGLLYIHLGDKLGWPVHGLALPGHFVISIVLDDDRIVLDPFNGGVRIDTPALRMLLKRAIGADAELQPTHLEAVSKRAVLLRLQNNIKTRALAENKLDRAAAVLERMTLIAPADPGIWYERGLIESEIGHLGAAAHALDSCLVHADEGTLRQSAVAARAKLRRQLN
jgi:regulator of sirC expression with transglutaminase-like and TPR domain